LIAIAWQPSQLGVFDYERVGSDLPRKLRRELRGCFAEDQMEGFPGSRGESFAYEGKGCVAAWATQYLCRLTFADLSALSAKQ
jgi:hypothetical protein